MERVYTIDGITGKLIDVNSATYCILDYIHGYYVFGWTTTETRIVKIFEGGSVKEERIPENILKEHFVYHRGWGQYFLDFNAPLREIVAAKYVKDSGYPYSFSKKYEAVENFNIFKGKQEIKNNIEFPIAQYFRYTFGLEFETSVGIIPEDLCFRDGLIPLRDGSITGNEYSTVVLQGNPGFNLLYQQIQTLKEYTRFDKECSLHIHIGGFPLVPEKIISLYNLCYILQNEISRALPAWTFHTAQYKNSGKDYCKLLPQPFNTFENFYKAFTGTSFFGDLQQAHPHDVERSRKWQISERYYWANLLNLICYKVNKTMEFRMLRPTYNLEKILFWMYIFNAILKYAETNKVSATDSIQLQSVLENIYPKDLTEQLMLDFYKCDICSHEQSKCGDNIGARIDIEEEFFDKNRII